MESEIFGYLVIAAFVMLALLTGGIGYLTIAEWRDRRMRDADSKAGSLRSSRAKPITKQAEKKVAKDKSVKDKAVNSKAANSQVKTKK